MRSLCIAPVTSTKKFVLVPYVHFGRSNTLYNKPTYSKKHRGRPSKFSKPQQDAPEAYVVQGRCRTKRQQVVDVAITIDAQAEEERGR
jgi:hypothetical protein